MTTQQKQPYSKLADLDSRLLALEHLVRFLIPSSDLQKISFGLDYSISKSTLDKVYAAKYITPYEYMFYLDITSKVETSLEGEERRVKRKMNQAIINIANHQTLKYIKKIREINTYSPKDAFIDHLPTNLYLCLMDNKKLSEKCMRRIDDAYFKIIKQSA